MKYLFLFIFSMSAFGQYAKLGMINKVVTTAGTPELVTTNDLYVRHVSFAAPSDNTGLVFLGVSAATATAANGITLTKGAAAVPGSIFQLGSTVNVSQKINLKDIYVNVATNGDHVNVLYIE
jgi:hypothetical protein